MGNKTAFIYDESYFWHDTGSGAIFLPAGGYVEPDQYVESAASKRRIKNLMDRCGITRKLDVITPRFATKEEVELYHTSDYIDKIKKLSDAGGGDAGDSATPFGTGSYEIALHSVGGGLTAVDSVMNNEVDNAYVLARPAGHHAESDCGRGFCIFNNAVIAAKYAREKYNVEKIMILDWDVHHGNGTESAFYDDPNTLFFSVHQEYNFPNDRGFVEHIGSDEGTGYTVNLPLPTGSSNKSYLYAFEQVIQPIVDQFKPELIIISAGQDANIYDPLSSMMLTSDCYREMTKIVKNLAHKHCNGKLIAIHEGGYSTGYVPFCTLAIIEELSEIDSGVEDPFNAFFTNMIPLHQLKQHQIDLIDEVRQTLRSYWVFDS